MKLLFLPTMSMFLIIITEIFLSLPTFVYAQNETQYQNCSGTFNCGNITSIGYPFWGSSRPSYCGHPKFELNCSNGTADIEIEGLNYRVLEINGESTNLKVAREDYIGGICPDSHVNTSLDWQVMDYASGIQNVTLHYNCPTAPFSLGSSVSSSFTCSDGTGFIMTRDLSNMTLIDYAASCATKVLVPGSQSAIQAMETDLRVTPDELLVVLEQGFGVQWVASNSLCETCRVSGGVCGYNSSTSSFACYCSNGQQVPFSCGGSTTNQFESGGKSKSVGLGVGLGIAGAAIAGIGLACVFLRIVQKRKRITSQTQSKDVEPPTPLIKGQAVPISNFSRMTPSDQSSKPDLEKGSMYFGTQVFSYEELVEATDNFDPSKELGDGGFGTVYYGILKDGRVVAVKRLYENNMKRAEQFMNEVEILTRLRHKNLVTLFGCTSKRSRELLLVYEYIPNGTVADHLHGRSRSNSGLLPWRVRLSIAIETADALAYLHISDVIHRDVKTNNILLDNNFHVKVVDFGLSRLFPNDVSHVSTAPQGTPGYVDPEYYQCYQLTDKSDVYSFGVVLVELISSLPAVDTNRHRLDINLANMAVTKIQNRQINELVDPSLGFETNAQVRKMMTSVAELAFRCLQQEKDMRPTMGEVLECLKKIEYEHYGLDKAEHVDIKADDVGLLSFSPDSGPTDKWVSSSTTTTTATASSF